MAVIAWRKAYETGIVALDEEHKGLIITINNLFEAVRDKQGKDVIDDILAMLTSYTQDHFEHEERLMAEYGFPGLEEHKAIHQQLRIDVQRLTDEATTGTEELAVSLLKFLRVWVLEHIVDVDKKYGDFLESRGGRFIS